MNYYPYYSHWYSYHWYEWLIFYLGGVFIGILSVCTGQGDRVMPSKHPKLYWLPPLLGIVFWPILLPFSFMALFMNIFYFTGFMSGCRFIIWCFKKMGFTDLKFEVKGKSVEI